MTLTEGIASEFPAGYVLNFPGVLCCYLDYLVRLLLQPGFYSINFFYL